MNTDQRVAGQHAHAHKRHADADRVWTRFLVALRRFGQRRTVAVVTFGLLALGGSSVIGLVTGGPLASVHDEFSYLVAADTFASFRLANPTPAHWQHFETYHVLMEPTYGSKYPPAQGLMLAVGQILTGSPATGVWLSVGVMMAAITWMLLVWLPPQWAVLAAIFGTVQLSWISYWGHSYWGGAVAATGGALAFGAYQALASQARLTLGLVLGVGLSILAISRPFEGAVAGACLAIAVVVRIAGARPRERQRYLWPLVVSTGVVAVTVAWHGYYNWRVTGSVLTMPHQLYQKQYSANPLLPFGTVPKTPTYRHAQMERFFRTWGKERFERHRSISGLQAVPLKIGILLVSLLGVGTLALVGIPGILQWKLLRFVFLTTLAVFGGVLTTPGSYVHYAAPVASLLYVALGAALWHLHRKARRTHSTNLAIVVVSLLIVVIPLGVARVIVSPYSAFARNRAAVVRQLESLPNRSLVFVFYGPKDNVHEEWVYNRADIEAAKVVWARPMGSALDRELIDSFPDRRVWRLVPANGISLEPYSPAPAAAAEQ